MEDDYMSDNFVIDSKELCPGLLNKYEKRQVDIQNRKQELDSRNRNANINKKELEETNRDKSLSTPLSSDNLGFKLLSKMGYTPNEGIGKINKRNFEPIRVDIKQGRKGIGSAPVPKKTRLTGTGDTLSRVKISQGAVDNYRASAREKVFYQRIRKNLNKAQKTRQILDEEAGIIEPPSEEVESEECGDADDKLTHVPLCVEEVEDETFFRTCKDSSTKFDPEEGTSLESMESELSQICAYLRDAYYYCLWCGCKYHDKDDMEQSCPGPTEDEH